MRRSKLFQVFTVVLLALSILVPAAFAAEGTAGDYFSGMGIQLGRGLWNIVSSPAEIPCTMRDDIKADGGVGAATGFGKGLAFFVRRVVVGASEILTFVMPSDATMPMVCKAPDSTPQVS